MTIWRDGMGWLTLKIETGAVARWHLLQGTSWVGVVRAPGWVQLSGPTPVVCSLSPEGAATGRADARARLAVRARRQRLPGWQRYDPLGDPRRAPDQDW